MKTIKEIILQIRIKWNLTFRHNCLIVEYAHSCIFMSKVEGEANRMEEKERLDGMESGYRRYKDEAEVLKEIQKAIKASIEDRKKAGKPSEIARSPKTETEKKKLIKPEDRKSVRAKLEKGKEQKKQEERQIPERSKKKSINRGI